MKRRHAYTLVEMVVAIGLTSVTLSVTAMTMHSLHRAERRMRSGFHEQRTLQRLVVQLRQDAHQASSASVTKESDVESPGRTVLLKMPDKKSVRYTVQTNRVEREVLKESNVEHRETFRLEAPNSKWIVKEQDRHTLLTLSVVPLPAVSHLDGGEDSPAGRVKALVDKGQQSAANNANLEIHAAIGLSAATNWERD